MQKITPFLWFDNNAEEAIQLYTSLFKNSKVKDIVRYGPMGPGPEGSVMTASFEIEGQEFAVINGGPMYKFTEAVSFVIHCDSQEEVDLYWNKLSEGGQEQMCGWLKDRFGLSWQIIPRAMIQMFKDKDGKRAQRAMQAMMKMRKIDIPALQRAFDGETADA
ncbi:MAG: VOC family protein [Sphingobacteriales bacterium]|nr:MAG: VOC family protein [Sphingobacteriales bacterium]